MFCRCSGYPRRPGANQTIKPLGGLTWLIILHQTTKLMSKCIGSFVSLLMLWMSFSASGQAASEEMVSNGGFEECVGCHPAFSEIIGIESARGWSSQGPLAHRFSAKGGLPRCGVPENYAGQAAPRSDSSYAGVMLFISDKSSVLPVRGGTAYFTAGSLDTKLRRKLTLKKKYRVSFGFLWRIAQDFTPTAFTWFWA